MRTRSLWLVAGLCLALTGCATEPSDVVSETTSKLDELRSGHVDLSVTASTPDAGGEQAEAGFELTGSFQLPEEGALPVAEIEYTDLSSEDPVTQGFVSTGEAAFILVDGTAYEIPPDQADILRGGSEGEGLFEQLQVAEWIREPVLSEDEEHSGEKVDRVTGELDVAQVMSDLVLTAQRFGRSDLSPIDEAEAERLDNAVRSSRIELLTGAEDRLLRSLSISIEFALDESLDLDEVLGPLAGAVFELDLTITDPNEPVEVEAPSDPLPLEELGSTP